MPLRDDLEAAARQGVERARRRLDGPECPPRLRGLLALARALHGKSGVTMAGLAPLSYATLRHYRLERGLPRFDEDEIDAVFVLDAVMLNPGTFEESEASG